MLKVGPIFQRGVVSNSTYLNSSLLHLDKKTVFNPLTIVVVLFTRTQEHPKCVADCISPISPEDSVVTYVMGIFEKIGPCTKICNKRKISL